jgi:hypothetical protein
MSITITDPSATSSDDSITTEIQRRRSLHPF